MITMIKKFKKILISLDAINDKLDQLIRENADYKLSIQNLLAENNWSHIFNSAVQGSNWFKSTPLNIGRWAGNFSFFYILFRILNEVKPVRILELGLGESTKMLQAYIKDHNPNSFCLTIEHSNEWIELKKKDGVSEDYINILQVNLIDEVVDGYQTIMYFDLHNRVRAFGEKFNLIIVDGPFGSEHYSRYNIIDIVKNELLDKEFIIIMDDVERNGEIETVQELLKLMKELDYEFFTGSYSGKKDQLVVVSKAFRYLTSL